MKEFKSAKDFSRNTQPEKRRQVAENIHEARRIYFDRKKDLQQQLETLVREAGAKELQAAEARTMIGEAEGEINKSRQNFLRRLVEREKIRSLEIELGAHKTTAESLVEELEALRSALWEREQSLQDRSALDSARDKLSSFYQEADQDWQNYEEDREAGNIGNIARDRGAYVVHTFITPVFSPSRNNGVIDPSLNMEKKLDLLMTLEPTISASAVDKNHPTTFAPVGVLLGDGQVVRASSHDLGSIAMDRKTRNVGASTRNERMKDQLYEALLPENAGGWTEFVVAEPKVAGLFFRLNPDRGHVDDLVWGSGATISNVVEVARARNLPLFVLRRGEFYSITHEEALALTPRPKEVYEDYLKRTLMELPEHELKEENRLTPESLTELPTEKDEQYLSAALERFMTDSPFDIWLFPEALQVAARADGRSLYNLYKDGDPEELNVGEKRTIPAGALGHNEQIEVTVLKTVPGPTHWQHYVKLPDGQRVIWHESRNPLSPESRSRRLGSQNLYRDDKLVGRDSRQCIGLTEGIPLPDLYKDKSATVEDIIEAAKTEIKKGYGHVKFYEERGDQTHVIRAGDYLKRIASSLFGIAEEAQSGGDIKIADRARQMAEKIMSAKDYQDMLARRVSESGTFKITREELVG